MSREIKFRGRDIHGVWHYGYLFQGETENNEKYSVILKQKRYQCDNNLTEDCPFAFYKDEIFVVDPKTVGQFTGLYDKNGKEIYDGDIVRFYFMSSKIGTSELFPTSNFLGEIKTNKYNQYMILSDGLEIHIENAIKYGEVIGNIHDDPELLKQE